MFYSFAPSHTRLPNSLLKQRLHLLLVERFVELETAGYSGDLYADYYPHQPVLGSPKLRNCSSIFAEVYQKSF